MPTTGPWRKAEATGFWHVCTNCPFYPEKLDVETSGEPPKGGWVCVTCRRLQADRECT